MSTTLLSTDSSTDSSDVASGDAAALRGFVGLALRRLGAQVSRAGDALVVSLPSVTESRSAPGLIWPDEFRSGRETRLVFSGADAEDASVHVTPRSQLVDWLIDRLAATPSVVHSAPVVQPRSAGEIAQRLLPAYRIENGRVQLGGCSLEDRAFFRVFARTPLDVQPARFLEWTIDADGRRVDDATANALHLGDTVPTPGALGAAPLPAATTDELLRMATEGARTAAGPLETVAATLVWCKWATGKVRIELPTACTELHFADWAATLAPPPYTCPYTGTKSFHVATTDNGRIAAAGEIAVCAESGLRTLRRELVECAATRSIVAAHLTELCPITDKPVLRRALVECAQCGELVSPAAIRDHLCAACHRLDVALPSDPRVARVLAEFPALDGWRKWRISETARVYILSGAGLMKRVLLVVDRETLEPKRLATASHLRRRWTPLPKEQWQLELGNREGA